MSNKEISEKDFNSLLNSLEDLTYRDFNAKDLNFSVDDCIEFFWSNPELQNPSSSIYIFFKNLLILRYASHYSLNNTVEKILDIKIDFPFMEMGNINSRHFFGIDELFIYMFYKKNKERYKTVCDIGTNVGLHSKILCSLGYEVHSYEPDINHSVIAKDFLEGFSNNTFHQKAVSNYSGKAEFTKIVNNTTGSYINDKKESYGPVDIYEVEVEDAKNLSNKFDLFKLDVEGSEVDILKSFEEQHFNNSDFLAEISTEKNRIEFWEYFSTLQVSVYSQKKSWRKVNSIDDLPTSHREGSIFISNENQWY